MYGDSFFTWEELSHMTADKPSFRPHVWGFFFHWLQKNLLSLATLSVFVPMYGDSFFT